MGLPIHLNVDELQYKAQPIALLLKELQIFLILANPFTGVFFWFCEGGLQVVSSIITCTMVKTIMNMVLLVWIMVWAFAFIFIRKWHSPFIKSKLTVGWTPVTISRKSVLELLKFCYRRWIVYFLCFLLHLLLLASFIGRGPNKEENHVQSTPLKLQAAEPLMTLASNNLCEWTDEFSGLWQRLMVLWYNFWQSLLSVRGLQLPSDKTLALYKRVNLQAMEFLNTVICFKD